MILRAEFFYGFKLKDLRFVDLIVINFRFVISRNAMLKRITTEVYDDNVSM